MEPFDDVDGDGIRDEQESFTDLDGDGSWGVDVPMTPERLRATIGALPGESISGIAIRRYGDTDAAEWDAILGSSTR